jgi:GT2 family glycosyltransferase
MKIAAAIVTYNRKNLLIECINAIRNQTSKPDSIIVINNSSSDGTLEWLENQKDLIVITQDNSGSSGGQYTAVKYCSEHKYDWVWLMDDDIMPAITCLEELVNIAKVMPNSSALMPVRFYNKKLITFEAKNINLTKFLFGLNTEFISENDLKKQFFEIRTIPFEGPLINIKAIRKIGYPNPDYFIIADDTDYSIRLYDYGNIYMVPNAVMNKLLFDISFEFNWKIYYQLRNLIIIDRKFGKNFLVRNVRPLITSLFYFKILLKSMTLTKLKYFFISIKHGYKLKMGKTINPGQF